ncbi:MAG: transporter, sialate:H+ symporter family protein, partial [Conexibacter sp.]|nr:transporter, sialate:H+ symporter family protein [Conexibacter sp.]
MGIAMLREQASGLTRDQRNAFLAAWLGWAMDAFDYFLLVFVISEVAADFGTTKTHVAVATTLTLAARPIGAALFGYWADRKGRRMPLLVDVLFYSVVEFATGFSTSLTMLLALRFLYGIGMGGEWGLGASLAMEKIPPEKRGFWSGVLQQGYPVGYLFAAVAFFVVEPIGGWRALFMVGAIPALLAAFIRMRVGESEAWAATKARERETRVGWRDVMLRPQVLKRFGYLVLLMGAFNFMSHGTQDFFPTLLQDDFGAGHTTTVVVAIIYNIGAIVGGAYFGAMSQSFGRKKTIILCSLCALPIVPLFAFAPSLGLITAGAFLMQLFVQGAWGVIPAHLSELSPDEVRGFYPGVTYQLGNVLAAANLPLQTWIASKHGGGTALAVVIAPVLIITALLTSLGSEARGIRFGGAEGTEAPDPDREGRFARDGEGARL